MMAAYTFAGHYFDIYPPDEIHYHNRGTALRQRKRDSERERKRESE